MFALLNPDEELYALPHITCTSIGMSLVLDELLKRDVLLECLEQVFAGHYRQLLSAAYYMVMEPDAKLSRLGAFARSYRMPAAAEELYPTALTKRHLLSKRRMWALDSTSVSTYAELNDAAYGRNKQDEVLPQINVMMITDEDSSRPLYYQYFNGSIPDVSECVNTFELLLNLGVHSFVAVADRGFFSAANMAVITDKGYHFLMCVPYEKCTGYQQYIDEALLAFTRDNLFDLRCGQNVYTCKEQTAVAGSKHKAYVHVFYNHEASGAQIDHYQRRLK
ncbi:IS1634 family transposase, partial [Succinatimonas hippei]|uniref:IS1634 family transposase n=1 Tax=Succinatimonas hippei TaxID=626938 RepID=UPI00165271C2